MKWQRGFANKPQGLAKAIAWDGEGATCLMEITCGGAKTDADARKVTGWLATMRSRP